MKYTRKHKQQVLKSHSNIHIRVQYKRYSKPESEHAYFLMGFDSVTGKLQMLNLGDILAALEWQKVFGVVIPDFGYAGLQNLCNPDAEPKISIN